MLTAVTLVTELVVAVKVVVVDPVATVTLAGTCTAAVLLLVSEIVAPPVGAAPLRVTVPVDEFPPVTLVGFSVTDDNDTEAPGFTVSVALLEPLLYVPVIVTLVTLATELVVTVNVAVVDPAATLTLIGTCAAVVLLLVRETLAPPVGAAPLSVTVPVDELPPVTLVGLSVTDDNEMDDAGFTVSVAVFVPLL